MDNRILHALDLAAVAEWDDARRSVEGIDEPVAVRLLVLIDELRRCDADRRHAQSVVRHELGNMLTIVQANVEGMLDGVVEPTPQRLGNVRDALASATELLQELQRIPRAAQPRESPSESLAFAELVSARVDELRAVAATKNVELVCDAEALAGSDGATLYANHDAVERALVRGLLNAVRYTPPGGAVHVIGCKATGELLLELRESAIAKFLDATGSAARVVEQTEDATILGFLLPIGKEAVP